MRRRSPRASARASRHLADPDPEPAPPAPEPAPASDELDSLLCLHERLAAELRDQLVALERSLADGAEGVPPRGGGGGEEEARVSLLVKLRGLADGIRDASSLSELCDLAANLCQLGAAPDCDDEDPCTVDSCSEEEGPIGCVNAPVVAEGLVVSFVGAEDGVAYAEPVTVDIAVEGTYVLGWSATSTIGNDNKPPLF